MAILSGPEHRGGRGRVVAVLVAGVVLLAVAGAWRLLSRPAEAPRSTGSQAASRIREAKPTPLPAPVAGAVSGTIEVQSSTAGAIVSVDGRELGRAPQRIELRAGPHQVRVEKEGFAPYATEVHVVPGHSVRLSARLEAEAPRLRVEADVPGALVFLDRKPVGKTPLELRDVPPGSHRLNVTAEGFEMYSETIDLESGRREVSVRFKEVRLDEALDVVHKHAIGSCRGRLVATTEGLRYETSEANDAFRAPFTALEPLRTDYQKKNLRVKLKGGKTYNFTAASADALLSFQQAVEAARKRL